MSIIKKVIFLLLCYHHQLQNLPLQRSNKSLCIKINQTKCNTQIAFTQFPIPTSESFLFNFMTHIVAINCYVFFQQKPYDNLWCNIIWEIYDPFLVHAKRRVSEREQKGRKAIKIKFMFNFSSSHSCFCLNVK